MRKDVQRRKELYDDYIIKAYEADEPVDDIAKHLGIKKQKVKHIAHTLGITGRWKHTTESFIEKAREMHGDTYDYSRVDYQGSKTKVSIICPTHGEFLQTPHMHISHKRQGCPKCSISSPHRRLIMLLDELGIPYENNNRELLGGRELDIYLPQQQLAIEVNGVYYHTLDKVKDKYYHYNKYKDCIDKGVVLLQFWDFEIRDKFPLVSSMLVQRLGLAKTIYARKTEVIDLTPQAYTEFLESNHLEGSRRSGVKLGLTYNGELVSAMGFSSYKDYYELDRFCSLQGYSVIGGFSKLLKHAPVDKPIVSYSFNRYSNGDVYKRNGFNLVRENKTSLFYYHQNKLKNRNNFMKYKLVKRLKIQNPENYTEKELAEMDGAFQVFGAGTKTWRYD